MFFSRFSPEARRGWGVTLALGAAVAAATIALTRPYVVGAAPQLRPNDDHSIRSVELATNWAVCGKYSIAFRGDSFGVFLAMAPDSQELRLRDLPALIAGSTERYCRLADQPWRNNENSLMLTMAAILGASRDATLADVGYAMRWIRIALVIGVALVMLRSGVSFWVTLGIAYASVIVMAAVEETRFYSVYPFLPVLLTAFIAFLVLLFDLRAHANLPRAGVAGALAGLIAAVAANFRSSYLPILAACFVLWIVFGAVEKRRASARAWKQLLAGGAVQLVTFVLAFALFQLIFIRPIDRLPITRNASYHVIAHPIVLGLAIPPNRLARDQGIEWSDRVGLDLARRIDPTVNELNQQYEDALFTYYRRLWRDHPRDMARLYWTKLTLSGADIPKYSVKPVEGAFFTVALWPFSLMPHGAFRVLMLAVLSVVPLLMLRRLTLAARGLIAFTAVTSLLLTLETAVILTYFYISHEAAVLLFAIATSLLIYQAILDGAAAWASRLLAARQALGPTGEPAS